MPTLTAVPCALQFPVSAFLGSYIAPDQLTLATVRSTAAPETFESAIATAEILAPGVLGKGTILKRIAFQKHMCYAVADSSDSLTQCRQYAT